MDEFEEAPFDEVSNDEAIMRVKEAMDDSDGFIVFSVHKDGGMQAHTVCAKLDANRTWGLSAFAEYFCRNNLRNRILRGESNGEDF